jgi:nucleoside-diphosphate-sugar epimerase
VPDPRILVTGGTGLIGSATVSLLESTGHEVRVFDLPSDIRDQGAVRTAIDGCDAVVHLAGIAGPELAPPVRGYDINARGTFTVFEAAVAAGIPHVVYASSINASGLPLGPGPQLPSRFPYDEDEPTRIGDWYSLSKVANEDAARMFETRGGTRFTGIRYPLVRDVTANGGDTFAAHLRGVLRDAPLRAAAEGWSYLDVRDAARAVSAALSSDTPAAPGILVAAPRTFLAFDTREAIAKFTSTVPVSVVDRNVGLDLGRSQRLLAFEAAILLDDVAPHALITHDEWLAL